MLINHYYKYPKVTDGSAKNLDELFQILIKDQFSNKDQIKAQHKALMEYVKQPSAVYFIRLYGSNSKKNYTNLRRGFRSNYADGNSLVFCDNTFALNFTAAKAAGLDYTYHDVNNLFNQNKLIFSFGLTSEEKELAYYSPSGAVRQNINPVGWTLAHIKPIGFGFDGQSLQSVFPNPNRDEWTKETLIREVGSVLSKDELKIARAHFIRLVHPLNSFLVPKKNLVSYEGKRLGEEPALINLVYQFLKDEFSVEMKELDEITMEYDFPISNPVININWVGPDSSKKVIKVESDEVLKEIEEGQFEEETSINLLKTLRSIGMKTFRDGIYPVLKSNPVATVEDIMNDFVHYETYTLDSRKSRLSSSKTIFRNGLEEDALELIANSKIE